jgi:hypothetical protein
VLRPGAADRPNGNEPSNGGRDRIVLEQIHVRTGPIRQSGFQIAISACTFNLFSHSVRDHLDPRFKV